MIHVLEVIRSLGGGATRSAGAIADVLDRGGGFRHSIVALESASPASIELATSVGCRVLQAPGWAELRRHLERADIVLVHWWNSASLNEFLRSELPPMRLVLYFHVAGDSFPHFVTRSLVDFADFSIACCPHTYRSPGIQSLPADLQVEKTAMVYATPSFARLSDIERVDHSTYNVGYIGRLAFRKLHPDFVSMCARVKIPTARFVVCGRDPEILVAQARALAVAERFEFKGHVEDLRSVYEVLDVFGYPLCVSPGSELSLQEALYAGVPAVVFGLGGIKDLVIDGWNGLVVRNQTEYVEAIEHLHHHPEERLTLGRNGRLFAQRLLGAERSAAKLERVYRRLMRRPKRSRTWEGAADTASPVPGGAGRWIDSLGDEGGAFRTSLSSSDPAEQLAAEKRIASLSHLGTTVMRRYARRWPEDPHLHLWMGLTLHHSGEHEAACASFRRAIELGLGHWRVRWHLARSTHLLGQTTRALELANTVLHQAPDFVPARRLAERLAGAAEPPAVC